MYVILDNTLGTMGDLLQWVGSENVSARFQWDEYDVRYKTSRQYHDFHFSNELNATCHYPRMWGEDGFPLKNESVLAAMERPCKDSEFDQVSSLITYTFSQCRGESYTTASAFSLLLFSSYPCSHC